MPYTEGLNLWRYSKISKNEKSWAVITGSSDGIGEQYAKKIAKLGCFNIVLVSRTLSKLQRVRKEILMKHPKIEVEILEVDFCGNANPEYY